MGTWGVTAFEDDSALDWLSGQFAEDGAQAVSRALYQVADFPASDYLERDEGVEARIAAEVVSIAFGYPPMTVPIEISTRVDDLAKEIVAIPFIRLVAIKAINRLLSDSSEINELWIEEESNALEWNSTMADLLVRLGS